MFSHVQNIMKNISPLLKVFILFFLLLPANLYGQTDYRVQSMFIYNFTTMVSWPAEYQSGDFIIAVFSDDQMYNEFQTLSERRSVGGRNIVANHFSSVNQITKCHILYVPTRQARVLPDIVNHLKARNINALIITDARGTIRNGSVINFTIQHDRQRFEVSQRNARNMGLTLGGEILRLGIAMD